MHNRFTFYSNTKYLTDTCSNTKIPITVKFDDATLFYNYLTDEYYFIAINYGKTKDVPRFLMPPIFDYYRLVTNATSKIQFKHIGTLYSNWFKFSMQALIPKLLQTNLFLLPTLDTFAAIRLNLNCNVKTFELLYLANSLVLKTFCFNTTDRFVIDLISQNILIKYNDGHIQTNNAFLTIKRENTVTYMIPFSLQTVLQFKYTIKPKLLFKTLI